MLYTFHRHLASFSGTSSLEKNCSLGTFEKRENEQRINERLWLDGVLVQSHSSLISLSSTAIHSASVSDVWVDLYHLLYHFVAFIDAFCLVSFEQKNYASNISRLVAGFTRRHFHVNRLLEQHFIGIFIRLIFISCLFKQESLIASRIPSNPISMAWKPKTRTTLFQSKTPAFSRWTTWTFPSPTPIHRSRSTKKSPTRKQILPRRNDPLKNVNLQ